MKNLQKIITGYLLFISSFAFSQSGFSIATDIGLQRNFKKGQEFIAVGQTLQSHFHITDKEGVYFLFSYFSNGKFSNNLIATAKDQSTIPQQLAFKNKASMRLRNFSMGYKCYLHGHAAIEEGWSLYGVAGLGIISGTITNTQDVVIDTALYNTPVLSGTANFKRLTLDLCVGYERPVGGDFFIYTEARAWIPTTDYPSPYLFENKNAPFAGMLCAGLRIMF